VQDKLHSHLNKGGAAMDRIVVGILQGCAVFLVATFKYLALADDRVKDFENAINYMQDRQGCRSIPYSDLQSSCESKQSEVNKLCKESGERKCVAGLDPKDYQKQIEELKTRRDVAKTEKEALERNKSSLKEDDKIRENDNKIKEAEGKIDAANKGREYLEKQVAESRRAINDRLIASKQCRDYRVAVMEIFARAKSKLESESDEAIKPLAKRLLDGHAKEVPGHQEQIKATDDSIKNCEGMLYDIDRLPSF
jgi:hypothetical protein